jgi:hypothetical protein
LEAKEFAPIPASRFRRTEGRRPPGGELWRRVCRAVRPLSRPGGHGKAPDARRGHGAGPAAAAEPPPAVPEEGRPPGDAVYDVNPLYEAAAAAGRRPGSGGSAASANGSRPS